MRHRLKVKKLNRTTSHRRSLYRNLTSSLVEHGAIETTLVKAKAVKPVAERIITKAKKGDLTARRALLAFFYQRDLANKLLLQIAPKFANRAGGYTRIVKLGKRLSDGAEMARLEFVADINQAKPVTTKKAQLAKKEVPAATNLKAKKPPLSKKVKNEK